MRDSPLFRLLIRGTAISSVALLGLIVVFLIHGSWGFFQREGAAALFTDSSWQPTSSLWNIVPMLLASLLVALGAVLLAAPLGIALALYCRYFSPAFLSRFYLALIELLAGIPSVVYGLWGLVILVPIIAAWVPPGASLLAGILILAIMVLPLMTLSVDNALRMMPPTWMQAAQALSLSRVGMIRQVFLPQAWPAIRRGAVLQTGRALGETMAVLMVCGNVVRMPSSVFDPARTLTANIALEMSYATQEHVQALLACALILLILTAALVFSAPQEPAHAEFE
ncbi:MAG: phosphate ABC transporter permease subunit PstC [Oceanococcus sp.]